MEWEENMSTGQTRYPKMRWAALPLMAFLTLGANCDQQNNRATETPAESETTEAQETAGEAAAAVDLSPQTPPTDGEIRRAIRFELLLDEGIPSHRIDVTVEEGIVNLTGSVDSLHARRRAVERTEIVRGVRSVVNQLDVVPGSRPDAEVERDIIDALLFDPTTESYELEVEVENGQVTLSGEVDSWQEQELAKEVARSVRGVRGINDEILIDDPGSRPDIEIQSDVESALENDRWLDDATLTVSVDEGVVTLGGTVGSATERRRAATLAWITGVREVHEDDIVVEPWADREMAREPRPTPAVTDEQIEDSLEDAFVYDARMTGQDPEIYVEDGVVTLTGHVGSVAAQEAAERTARNTVGVWRVRNFLQVRPPVSLDDETLEANVARALGWNTYVEHHEVQVNAVNGHVSLYGTVDNDFERQEAARVVGNVAGVIEVDNYLEVRESDDDTTDDWALRRDIEEQIFWDPWIDSSEITVAVDNGLANMTGTVEDWEAYRRATDNALEAGAGGVVNRLRIERNGPPELVVEIAENEVVEQAEAQE